MLHRYALFILTLLIVQACSSGSGDGSNVIDYATLDSLQTEMVLEIGESENFIAGRLGDLMTMPNGDILVGDFANVTIEQFDAEGNHTGTIATEGGGPGEITQYFSIKNIGNDSLIVLINQMTQQRDYFTRGKDNLFQFARSVAPENKPEGRIRILGAESDSTYYAISGFGIQNIEDEMKNRTDYKDLNVMITNQSFNIVRDSVHLLKTPTYYFLKAGNGVLGLTIPYRKQDHFVLLDNGKYIIARPDSNQLDFYDSDQQLQRSLELKVKPRPVTSADLDYELDNRDRQVRNEIEARVDDNKPPYRIIWATDNYLWLHTDTGEAGKEIVVFDYEGNPQGKFMLPEIDKIEAIWDNKVYTIHENPDKGDLIRVYKIAV